MHPRADFAPLVLCALACTALALRTPVLRPHAAAAWACAALYAARWMGSPRVDVAVFVLWPGVAVWLWAAALGCPATGASEARRGPVFAGAWVAYAAALAWLGSYLAAVWPWPLLAPSALPLLLAAFLWRLPRTWSQRAALVLPASVAADLVTVWSGAPATVRVVLGGLTWVIFAAMCLAARNERA